MSATDKTTADLCAAERLAVLSKPELIALRVTIEATRGELKSDFDEKRRKAAVNGKYLETGWYSATEARIARLGRLIQRVQSELTKRKAAVTAEFDAKQAANAKREDAAPSFENRFVDAARVMLPARLFRDISRAAAGTVPVIPAAQEEP